MAGIEEFRAGLDDAIGGNIVPAGRHSARWKAFSERWGWQRVAYELAEGKIEALEKVYKANALEVIQLVAYLGDRGDADDADWKMREQQSRDK